MLWWFVDDEGFLYHHDEVFMQQMAYLLRVENGQDYDEKYDSQWDDTYQDVIDWLKSERKYRHIDEEEAVALLFGIKGSRDSGSDEHDAPATSEGTTSEDAFRVSVLET